MSQQHTPAAISLQTKLVQSIAFRVIALQQSKIFLPLVADDFSTRKTANWDDHWIRISVEHNQQTH
jgi:hypothetical protein